MSSTRYFFRWTAIILLLAYMMILTKKILFKKGGYRYYKEYFSSEYKRYSVKRGWQMANTVPFRTIKLYKKGLERNNTSAEYNIWGNLLGFIPLGLLLPLALPWFRHLFRILLAGFIISLCYETTQLLTGLGIWDVDDLLLNTAGVLIGYIIFFAGHLAVRLLSGKKE